MKLDKEEFVRLKEDEGKLISTNDYLSANRLRESALRFEMKRSKRTNITPVLSVIECYVKDFRMSVILIDSVTILLNKKAPFN